MTRLRSLMSAFGKSMLFAILGFLMPIHGKRIFLITTLQLQLVRDGIFKEEALEKFNEALRLAKFDDALKLPALFYDQLWDDEKLQAAIHAAVHGDIHQQPVSYEEARKISERILDDATPKWMRYGRKDDMINDIVVLFYRQNSLQVA